MELGNMENLNFITSALHGQKLNSPSTFIIENGQEINIYALKKWNLNLLAGEVWNLNAN